MYERLIELLQNQSVLYSELLESAQQKKGYIIKNDIESISKVTSRENTLIGKLRQAERERQAQAADIAKRLHISSDGLTLAILISRVNNSSIQERLECLRMQLRSAMDDLKALNDQNRALINQSLEYIDFTVNLLRSTVSGPVYAGAEEIHGQVFFEARG